MSNASDQDIAQMNAIVERARATDEHGHGLCPWCGGRARMEVLPSKAGHMMASPCCMVCGLETPTISVVLGTLDQWVSLPEERRGACLGAAWEAWDRAWWRGGA